MGHGEQRCEDAIALRMQPGACLSWSGLERVVSHSRMTRIKGKGRTDLKIRHGWAVVWAAIGITLALGVAAASQSGILTFWNLPFERAFPAGLSLGDGGTVYVAAEGGMVVFRLDPASDVYRSWGVGEGPEDVTVAEGVVFCSVGDDNLVVFLNPGGLAVSSAVVPFAGVMPGEIHRGANTDDGNMIFWIAERGLPGFLRFEYNPALDAPGVVGSPSDSPATRQAQTISARAVTPTYERFAYDVTLMPPPYGFTASRSSYPFAEWLLPLEPFGVEDIAVASDGKLWISFGGPSLFLFDPAAGTLQEMETIQNVAIFQGLLPAVDGSIWFGNIVEGAIGHFDPSIGLSEVWRIPGTGEVYDLVFADDGAIWYTDRVGDAIGRLDTVANEVTIYPLPEGSEPLYLAIDDDGAVWFTAGSGNYIGRMTVVDWMG